MNYLSFDIGTTCCKCQLFSEDGNILEYLIKEYEFKHIEENNYIDVDAIWEHFSNMLKNIAAKHEISSICISSLGESFVLLDEDDNILFYPMLYNDARGEEEALDIARIVGLENNFLITGVLPHSMYSISKLLWIKKHYPEVIIKAKKIMLMCDYIGYKLTGMRVIDYSLASRTGVFDINNFSFSKEILEQLDISIDLFSTPRRAGTVIGSLKKDIIDDFQMKGEPVLVLGSHDQICTLLGAGALDEGEAVDGMGTVECLTTIFSTKPTNLKMGEQGYPCVPYVIDGLFCTYILNYSCGSTINWFRKKIIHNYKGDEQNFYSYIEKDMTKKPTGILSLPYFGGAATPYQDLNAKGAIINLTTETSDSNLYKSLMEGTAMEMRLNCNIVSEYNINIKKIVATGGCSNSTTWMQVKADIQNTNINILRSSEGGLCGCAMLQSVALGSTNSLYDAKKIFVEYTKEFVPDLENHMRYEEQYKKYKKLYNTLKEIF